MELKPLICTQCGAPLKHGRCEYCGVAFEGAKSSQVDFQSMTNEEFQQYKSILENNRVEIEVVYPDDGDKIYTPHDVTQSTYDLFLLKNAIPRFPPQSNRKISSTDLPTDKQLQFLCGTKMPFYRRVFAGARAVLVKLRGKETHDKSNR